jgi:small subunit ribosomal protein S1
LVHISDLSWTKKIRHPGEVVKKGDEVDVVVLNVDKGNRRISLGYKQTRDNPWDTFESDYKVHTKTTGKIVRMIDKGVIVELPSEVDGFVPLSHLAKTNLAKPAEGYAVGDAIELVVIEFNKDNKKIILSERLTKESTDGEGKRKKKGKKGAEGGSEAGAEGEAAATDGIDFSIDDSYPIEELPGSSDKPQA